MKGLITVYDTTGHTPCFATTDDSMITKECPIAHDAHAGQTSATTYSAIRRDSKNAFFASTEAPSVRFLWTILTLYTSCMKR